MNQLPHKIIVMWSGPRNISTAMMRSWENRPDTVVYDEPLYGHYLHHTGLAHPGGDEVIAAQGPDWQTAVEQMMAPLTSGKQIHYQKHMTHHLFSHIDQDWFAQVEHCFFIWDPHEVVASYAKERESVTLDDIGFWQQVEIFERVIQHSDTMPPILDAQDVLNHPASLLTQLCEQLDIVFDANMLSWPPGSRDSDGIWAKHWYDSVNQSTGFKPYVKREVTLDPRLEAIAEQARPYYETLYSHRLTEQR